MPNMNGFFRILARWSKFARFALLQIFQRNVVSIKRSWLFSPATQPDALKVLAQKTYLYPSRIFKPRIKDALPTPLIIMVHGGGFIMNNPSVDDPLARYLADNCKSTVVSIDYRKSPIHKFPAAYEDVVESISALLKDSENDTSIDMSKVVLFGCSAGGNLILTAAQDPRLRGKLLGAVAMYSIANMNVTVEEQMAKRPDPSVPDFLGHMWDDLLEIYVGTTDIETLKDPRLSPTYFSKREDLPKNIYLIGCEHDMLCHELGVMAEKLIVDGASRKETTEDGWQAGGVCWTLVKGQPHAFDVFPKKVREEEEKRLRDKDLTYQRITQWLNNAFGTVELCDLSLCPTL